MEKPPELDDIMPMVVAVTFIALVLFGTYASADARLEVVGAVLGSAITIIGAYWLFNQQNAVTEYRHLETMRDLIGGLRKGGEAMVAKATTDPVRAASGAVLAYEAAKAVAAQLRANGAAIARVAQMLEMDEAQRDVRQIAAGIGNHPSASVAARGQELIKLADSLLAELKKGL